MYSDHWIKLNYKKTEVVQVDKKNYINYYYWKDNKGNYIGISINFEYADDVHVELFYEEWCKFVERSGFISKRESTAKSLGDFFNNKSVFDFKDYLNKCGIQFSSISFYEPIF